MNPKRSQMIVLCEDGQEYAVEFVDYGVGSVRSYWLNDLLGCSKGGITLAAFFAEHGKRIDSVTADSVDDLDRHYA